jgi:predicted HicB family RNase H-like nuclease
MEQETMNNSPYSSKHNSIFSIDREVFIQANAQALRERISVSQLVERALTKELRLEEPKTEEQP